MHDIAHAAADAAVAPDFDALLRRGRRQRNVRNGTALGAAAVAVASIFGISQLAGGPGDTPQPAPAETPTIAPDRSYTARPAGVAPVDAASAGDAIATVWPRKGGLEELVILQDQEGGVRTRTFDLPAGTTVTSAGDGRFVVVEGGDPDLLRVVTDIGEGLPVTVSEQAGPVAEGEVPVVVGRDFRDNGVVAVDPESLTAHPVEVPDEVWDVHAYGGRIQALGSDQATAIVHWSDDGGATWEQEQLVAGTLPVLVPTSVSEPLRVIATVDGAVPKPLEAIHERTAPGEWTETRYDDLGNFTFMGAFSYGEQLRFLGTSWDESGEEPWNSGVFSADDRFVEEVRADDPPEGLELPDLPIVAVEYEDGPVVWVPGEGAAVYRSADGGSTWERYETAS